MCDAVQVQIAMPLRGRQSRTGEVVVTREDDSVARAAVSAFAAVSITVFTAISSTGLFTLRLP